MKPVSPDKTDDGMKPVMPRAVPQFHKIYIRSLWDNEASPVLEWAQVLTRTQQLQMKNDQKKDRAEAKAKAAAAKLVDDAGKEPGKGSDGGHGKGPRKGSEVLDGGHAKGPGKGSDGGAGKGPGKGSDGGRGKEPGKGSDGGRGKGLEKGSDGGRGQGGRGGRGRGGRGGRGRGGRGDAEKPPLCRQLFPEEEEDAAKPKGGNASKKEPKAKAGRKRAH